MTTLDLRPAGSTFHRIGGRSGKWRLHAQRRQPDYPLDPDDDVICPFDFVEVPALQAEATISELRRAHPRKTPILFGSPHDAGILMERIRGHSKAFGRSPSDWLHDADTFDLDAWFAERVARLQVWQAEDGKFFPPRGKWPAAGRKYHSLTVPIDLLTDKPHPSVIIGLLPTADPTETAAHLQFGGWNDCPKPPVHVLLARQWHERYGAVQVTNTYETVEFQVAKPLNSREEALRLAMDQYHWCSDSIPETLQVAAEELIGSTVWVFWWD